LKKDARTGELKVDTSGFESDEIKARFKKKAAGCFNEAGEPEMSASDKRRADEEADFLEQENAAGYNADPRDEAEADARAEREAEELENLTYYICSDCGEHYDSRNVYVSVSNHPVDGQHIDEVNECPKCGSGKAWTADKEGRKYCYCEGCMADGEGAWQEPIPPEKSMWGRLFKKRDEGKVWRAEEKWTLENRVRSTCSCEPCVRKRG
jgi:rubrerythrin